MKLTLCILLITLAYVRPLYADAQWQGSVPSFAQDSHKWELLIKELNDKKLYYGALAASFRVLTFFSDLQSKEMAYKTLISLVDQGYPFSTKAFFVAGDIDPQANDEFTNSYFFYKGLIARDHGMEKWAEHYFTNLDKENFPKYLFYSAIESYAKKDYPTAEKALKKILSTDLGPDQAVFAKKVARTLARLYFEQENYAKSFDIYQSFLLKVNPVTISDWLEAAWNLYYLKRYNQAIGYLFNLESKSAGESINLEKYLLRGLVYQRACDNQRMESLLDTFGKDFGPAINGIKSGESLQKLSQLKTIYFPDNGEYNQTITSLKELKRESGQLDGLPSRLNELSRYLYSSEISHLNRKMTSYSEEALYRAASHLITVSESLRFLKFDVSRERYDPDAVFQVAENQKPKEEKVQQAGFEIHWMQMGDFWRDEREDYRGVLRNRCH
jgi:tetratricopeptide (TPR) repeat protein